MINYILPAMIIAITLWLIKAELRLLREKKQDNQDDGLDPHERYLNARHKQIDKIDKTNGW